MNRATSFVFGSTGLFTGIANINCVFSNIHTIFPTEVLSPIVTQKRVRGVSSPILVLNPLVLSHFLLTCPLEEKKTGRWLKAIFENVDFSAAIPVTIFAAPLLLRGVHWGIGLFDVASKTLFFGEGLNYSPALPCRYGPLLMNLATHLENCYAVGNYVNPSRESCLTLTSSQVWCDGVNFQRIPFPAQPDPNNCGPAVCWYYNQFVIHFAQCLARNEHPTAILKQLISSTIQPPLFFVHILKIRSCMLLEALLLKHDSETNI